MLTLHTDSTINNQIIIPALNHGGILFGGILRDFFSGQESNDLDIFFQSELAFNNFLKKMLQTIPIRIERIQFDKEHAYLNDDLNEHWRIFAQDFKLAWVDCIIGTGHGTPWGLKDDCNVNLLMYSKSAGLHTRPTQDLFSILRDCREKQFTHSRDVEQHRISKLHDKGFTLRA